jgi:hypothetical protein
MAVSAMVEGWEIRYPSAAYQPLLRWNSTGFCTGVFLQNPQQIRMFYTCFAQLFRLIYQHSERFTFHQLFRRVFRREKGRKAGGMGELWKTAFRR